jgi:hypothetical protein
MEARRIGRIRMMTLRSAEFVVLMDDPLVERSAGASATKFFTTKDTKEHEGTQEPSEIPS